MSTFVAINCLQAALVAGMYYKHVGRPLVQLVTTPYLGTMLAIMILLLAACNT